mmetsp:Transcript_8397/g.15774  ORF Transcript_8397/g.15774 Transcript_8397/m.15774 type:complete len:214 (-) Transcript_8397:84-725(-)
MPSRNTYLGIYITGGRLGLLGLETRSSFFVSSASLLMAEFSASTCMCLMDSFCWWRYSMVPETHTPDTIWVICPLVSSHISWPRDSWNGCFCPRSIYVPSSIGGTCSTTSPPYALMVSLVSCVKDSSSWTMHLYPREAENIAAEIPLSPDVTTVIPCVSFPACSSLSRASCTHLSCVENPGEKHSNFAKSWMFGLLTTSLRSTSGDAPTRSVN